MFFKYISGYSSKRLDVHMIRENSERRKCVQSDELNFYDEQAIGFSPVIFLQATFLKLTRAPSWTSLS